MNIKIKVFNLLSRGAKDTPQNRRVELAIIILICLSVIQIIAESYQSVALQFSTFFYIFEIFTIVIFTIEYVLRLWVADLRFTEVSGWRARLKFIFSPMGLIDLLAILPFYLPILFKIDLRFIRILRVIRLLRVFKLARYSSSLMMITDIFREKRSEISITVFVNVILILIASTIMYDLENEVQPDKFPNIIETFWWAVATLTTVGYGDVYPLTGWGKVVSSIIAILGIGMVALPTGIISSGFIERINKPKKVKLPKVDVCPHCGKEIH